MPQFPPSFFQSQIRERFMRFAHFWFPAFRQVLPLYISVQIVLLVIGFYAPSAMHLVQADWTTNSLWSTDSLSVFWRSWYRWDTVHYLNLVQNNYPLQYSRDIAYFPLFPLLVRGLTYIIPDALIAGLLLSHIATFILMLVLYQLIKEEFGEKVSYYALICLNIFPTALFLWAAYPESLFLCLVALSFYAMYHQEWWLAGVFALFACLARPNGIILLVPFCYEYLRQKHFQWRAIRWDALSVLLLPAAILLFAFFCYVRYGDPLAFAHAQSFWLRTENYPWYGIIKSLQMALSSYNVFQSLCMLSLDLLPNLLALFVIVIALFGRNHLGSHRWTYILYAIALWLFSNSTFAANKPLIGVGRNTLMILPLFLMLGLLTERYRWFRVLYFPFSAALCFFWLVMFLTGYTVD